MLENIELSRDEYEFMKQSFCDYGDEAYIIKDGHFMIKLFRDDFGQKNILPSRVEEIRQNKLSKIVTIYDFGNLFENELKPFATYSCGGEFVGYRGKWIYYPKMRFAYLDRDEIKNILWKLRSKLQSFHSLGIVYGDIKDDNIFISSLSREIVFGDIDNMKVGEYSMDMMNCFIRDFIQKYGELDVKLDSYMFNLLTLGQFYYYDSYEKVIEQLRKGIIPKEVDSFSNRKVLREMKCIRKDYSGNYLVDHVC